MVRLFSLRLSVSEHSATVRVTVAIKDSEDLS